MISNTNLGLEISGKDLRVAVIRGLFGKLRLLRLDEITGFMDLSLEDQKTALVNLIKKHKISPSGVFLTLPRDRGIVRQIEFPAEIRENLKSAVTLQVEGLCPWPAEEIYWDFAYQEPQGGAKTIIVTVGIIPRANLDPWIEFFKSLKLPLSSASLSSTSCAHGVRALWTDANSSVVLNCEPGYVEATLINGGHLTMVRQTGEDVTSMAKTAVEQVLSSGRIQESEVARLLVYGAGAVSLEGIEPVRLPLENAPAAASGRFGAIASGLSGLKKTGYDCNLIPGELRFRRNPFWLVPTYVLVFFTILLGSAMVLREPYQLTVYASKLDSEIRLVAPQVKEVSSQAVELDRLAQRYRALLANFQNKDYNLESLRELANSLPPTVWLTNYTYQDGAVTITGIAPSASEVQKVIEDTALFKDVQFTSSVARDADGKERFSLKASIEVPR